MANQTQTYSDRQGFERRASQRRPLVVPGRLVWRDARGMTRFATVVMRDVSDAGAFVECLSGTPIPLYRLAHLQIDGGAKADTELPPALRQSRILTAVYRVGPSSPSTGLPEGYALRLLVDPRRLRAESPQVESDTALDQLGDIEPYVARALEHYDNVAIA